MNLRGAGRSAAVQWPWLGLALLVVLIVAIWWSDFSAPSVFRRVLFEGDQSLGGVPGINLTEVVTDSDDVMNEVVSVSGPVDEVLGPHAFILGSSGITTFFVEGRPKVNIRRSILVVYSGDLAELLSRPADAPLQKGMVVEVTGEVGIFEIGRFSQNLGVTFEAFERLRDLEEKPVLVAHAIEVGTEPAGPGDKELTAESDGLDLGYRVSDIVADPETYQGRRVQVSGEIELILSPHIFILSDHQLLVLAPDVRFPLLEEATAYVVGEVSRLSEQHLEMSDFPEWLREREGQPVLIATDVITIR